MIMYGRIALIESNGMSAVFGLNFLDSSSNLVESFIPRNGFPSRRCSSNRGAETIGIVMNVAQRDCLGANMPAAERVVIVTLDRNNLVALVLDDDAAHGFAQITRSEVFLGRVHGGSRGGGSI